MVQTEIEYDIIFSNSTKGLVQEMAKLREAGWAPHGSMVLEQGRNVKIFYQPITRKVIASRPNTVTV